MDIENLKIKTYESAVKSLPDYPSDEGYTAEMLKDVFDARSDNEIKDKHNALVDALSKHSENKENPHGVTKEQLGLSNVDNTADIDKPISRAVETALSEHSENKANPHSVTKAQLGLSNVDNTADMDKPVSHATREAILEHSENRENPHGVTAAQIAVYTKEEVDDMLGDISSTLDSITALQNLFIGGDAV